jgi:hypothetical protein
MAVPDEQDATQESPAGACVVVRKIISYWQKIAYSLIICLTNADK